MILTISELCIKRPEKNPKGAELELDTDWNIEYSKKEDGFEYKCSLKTDGEFPFKISVKGKILNSKFNEVPEEVSLKILNNIIEVIPNLLNLSKEKEIKIKMPLKIKRAGAQMVAS
ncbi:hypothetical protein Mjas_08165 [Methanothermococcus sp. Ax23]|uniref:hypothetical protein n=1 Tax=Methanothermococcus sp. Ax23 TaxID=3156486 RepID=UPI003BA2E4C1